MAVDYDKAAWDIKKMSSSTHKGSGDRTSDRKRFEDNWDRIFNKEKKK